MTNVPYSNNFFEMDIIGNKRTGNQIEDWTSQKSIEIAKKFENWDGKSEMNFEIPNEGKGEVSIFTQLLENENLPKKLSGLGHFNLYKSSKITDFISGSFLSQFGIIVSKKVKEIMEGFNLGDHRFYPIELEQNGKFYPDYFLLKTLAKTDEHIILEQSSFYYNQLDLTTETMTRIEIAFKNQKEIDDFINNNKGKDYSEWKMICSNQLMINDKFPNYDLFYSTKYNDEADSRYPILSERLKNALDGTTGIEFKPTNRIKCCC